jgi:hypothetical protein
MLTDLLMQNRIVIAQIVVIVSAMFIYGRYQYLRGLLKGRDDGDHYGITAADYDNHGQNQYARGYIAGHKQGMADVEKLSASWSCGWIDECNDWRELIDAFVRQMLEIKSEEPEETDED